MTRFVYVCLQGLTTLISVQRSAFIGLVDTYSRMTEMIRRHFSAVLVEPAESIMEANGRFVL